MELACKTDMFCDMVWDCCKALNWASCAAKAVSLCGFNGSCDDIWVTSNCRKLAWSRFGLAAAAACAASAPVTELMAVLITIGWSSME